MKNECSIVRDLLPLQVENLLSKETDEMINEHIENCPECQNEKNLLADANTKKTEYSLSDTESKDGKTMNNIRKKILKNRLIAGTLSAILTITLVFVLFYCAAYIGVPLNSQGIALEKDFQICLTPKNNDIKLSQCFNLDVTDTNSNGIIMSVKRVPNDGYKGYQKGVVYEIRLRKTLLNFGQFSNTQTFTLNCDFDQVNNYYNEVVRVVFADKTLEYSMRDDGLFEYRDDINKISEILSEKELYDLIIGIK